MNITFTPAAAEQLQPFMEEPGTWLKLVFDAEGCGCSANGVPALWLVSEQTSHEIRAEGNPFPVLVEKRHLVYFEDHLQVNTHPETGAMRLFSSGQIYNPDLRVIDRRS
jgi:uncharacterized protein YqkB